MKKLKMIPQNVQGWKTESLIFIESIRLFSEKAIMGH